MQGIIDSVNNFLWTYILIGALLGAGLYFTITTRFVQFRYVKEMFRVLGDKSVVVDGMKSISSFKSFSIGAATRIGTGNLAGVAVAIVIGGPGAVFWMWVVALLGGATSFIESTLAQIYKVRDGQAYRGGPAYYIEKGLNKRWLGIIFAVLIAVTFGLIFNSVQSNTISLAFESAFGIDRLVVGGVVTLLTGLIIFGGVHRIANFSSIIVPVMALLYVGIAIVVIALNFSEIPAVFGLIVSNAFGFEEALGGGIGAAIMQGVRRGLFSNEAGMGSAPNAAATANVSHPAKQGFIQTLGVYVDTLIVCSATAFIILVNTDYQASGLEGIQLLQSSLALQIGDWAGIFVAAAIFMFAFSSIIGSYYYGETNIEFIKKSKISLNIYRFLTMGLVMFGSYAGLGLVWALADVFMALMTIINIIGIVLLGKIAIIALKDYERQRGLGLDPTFSPGKLGIKNTECWDEIRKEHDKVS
ncbi:alanine:cation symporter family protein [Jeotgalibacillus sp. S-D1]|uniref:alanine/glycine:cation symporter family protein n=1 Tax=Jeotgalibacillus sp. S-D1 TaxID=2552189 RepID=UPI00105A9FE8|nr:alanine/glycine:cation symporter family protein [Jeotgalibacillus sp. S-D1]TDL32506.1 alanine:cation symporter family protein [Jeotgalibacillus sp. S-D1]